MHRETNAINHLPAWAKVNHIDFNNISVQAVPCKGYGLSATAPIDEENALLLTVPRELILSLENVWTMAKADRSLREVLEAVSLVGDYARVKGPIYFCYH